MHKDQSYDQSCPAHVRREFYSDYLNRKCLFIVRNLTVMRQPWSAKSEDNRRWCGLQSAYERRQKQVSLCSRAKLEPCSGL